MEAFFMSWYERIAQRHDLTDAGAEVIVIVVVAFVLGFLCCYVKAER